ncbi:four helix bundle protein [Candidatus Ruminimicrobiellum ovillum]|uniref:four helix bundle protein n=1 Tax=Candidatus Ruminimicrobiellum ovillum TaxID=1947927 RepID=UPI00355A7217
MKKENIIVVKSKRFAVNAINLYKFLLENKKEYILSKQFVRSATSIGANIKEADNSMTKKEFISKLNISLKEANETEYWLELLFETNYLDEKQFNSFHKDCIELIKLLTVIIKTSISSISKK